MVVQSEAGEQARRRTVEDKQVAEHNAVEELAKRRAEKDRLAVA